MLQINNRKGFTLIELIIVIIILGILAAVAIPAATQYVYQSRVAVIQENIHNVENILTTTKVNTGYFTGDVLTENYSGLRDFLNNRLAPKTLTDLGLLLPYENSSIATNGYVIIAVDFTASNTRIEDFYQDGTTTPVLGLSQMNITYRRGYPTAPGIGKKISTD